VFGIAAAAINLMVLADREADPKRYVAVKESIAAGSLLDPKLLGFVEIDYEVPAAVPYDDLVALEGVKASRAYQRGDLILRQDVFFEPKLELQPGEVGINIALDGVQYEPELLRVGARIGFVSPNRDDSELGEGLSYRVLGPYRIVAIGSTATPKQPGSERSSRTISVAVHVESTDDGAANLDPWGAQLVQSKVDDQILAVVLYPAEEPDASDDDDATATTAGLP
jgi:hypothetical protein